MCLTEIFENHVLVLQKLSLVVGSDERWNKSKKSEWKGYLGKLFKIFEVSSENMTGNQNSIW